MSAVSGGEQASGDSEEKPEIQGYELYELIGRGGMGAVWRAKHLKTGRNEALKIINPGLLESARARARFKKEIELASRLEHPNIARVYDGDPNAHPPYYTMRLVRGVSLDKFVNDRDLSRKQILLLLQSVCKAIQSAHQRLVIHRDLKFSNILVTNDGHPYVVDFGLAKLLTKDVDGDITAFEGYAPGTLGFMSPEQAAGHSHCVDTRTDVYSLGVILYCLLVGEFPHNMSGSRLAVLNRIAQDEICPSRSTTKKLGKELESLLLKALAREPANRYGSARDLAQDIEHYLNSRPLIARPQTWRYRTGRWIRKYRVPVSTIAATVLMAVSFLTIAYKREQALRRVAENNQAAAEKQKDIATKESERATKLATAERHARYIAQIALAHARYEQGDLSNARRTLSSCPTDLRHWEWYWLWKLLHHSEVIFRFPKDKRSMDFSQNGDQVVVADKKGGVTVWNRETGATPILLTSQDDPSMDIVRISNSGRIVASGSDGVIKLWSTESSQCIQSLVGPSNKITALAFDPSERFIASGDGKSRKQNTIRVWEIQSGREICTFSGHDGVVDHLAFTPNGRQLISRSSRDLKIWKILQCEDEKIQDVSTPKWHYTSAATFSITPDSKRILFGKPDGTIDIWDLTDHRSIDSQFRHDYRVVATSVTPNGEELISCDVNGDIRLWEIRSGRKVGSLRIHEDSVRKLTVSQDGQSVISADDREIRLWKKEAVSDRIWPKPIDVKLTSDSLSYTRTGRSTSGIMDVEFSSTGNHFAIATEDGQIRFFDTKSRKELGIIQWGLHEGLKVHMRHGPPPIQAIKYTSGGRHIIARSGPVIRMWNVETGIEIFRVRQSKDELFPFLQRSNRFGVLRQIPALPVESRANSIALSPDSTQVAVAWNNKVSIIEIASGNELFSKLVVARAVHFIKNGKRIVEIGAKHASIWDVESGQKIVHRTYASVVGSHLDPISERAVLLANMKEGRKGLIWQDVETGEETAHVVDFPPGVDAVVYAVSPDGQRFAMGGFITGMVTLSDFASGNYVATLLSKKNLSEFRSIKAVEFSPDGSRVIAASGFPGRLWIWNSISTEAIAVNKETESGASTGVQ